MAENTPQGSGGPAMIAASGRWPRRALEFLRDKLWPTLDPQSKPDYWKPPRVYVPLSIFAFAVAVADYLFALAGVEFLDFIVLGTVNTVEPAAAGHVIGAAAGSIGGAIALITLYVNLCEKRYAQAETLRKDREIAHDQQENERNIAELQRLEEQFNQLSEDFSGSDLLARINAGIGLAHIARTPRPGLSDKETKTPTERSYPFYRRAANQLAAALHLYPEPQARDEVRKAIRQLGELDEGEAQPLLHLLLDSVADANRTAHDGFLRVLAEGIARSKGSRGSADPGETFSVVVRICLDEEKNSEMLKQVAQCPGCQRHLSVQHALCRTRPKGSDVLKIDAEYLERLGTAWRQLADTRDAIADLVRLRKPPPEMREALGRLSDELDPQGWRKLGQELREHAPLRPNLSGCFLQGASLEEAQLQGADLRRAQLQEASLHQARMQGTDLRGAKMNSASLFVAHVQGADLTWASIQGGTLASTRLDGADLTWANLREAHLVGAQLQGAQLQGADLRQAQLRLARIAGSVLIEKGATPDQKANLEDSSLEADFRFWARAEGTLGLRPTDQEDTDLIEWIQKYFPNEAKSIPSDREERFKRYREWDEETGIVMMSSQPETQAEVKGEVGSGGAEEGSSEGDTT